MYNDYNKSHVCVENVFSENCCGGNFAKSDFFKANPNAFQIHLAIDEFEPCSPLKSKALTYKTLSIYGCIANLCHRQ